MSLRIRIPAIEGSGRFAWLNLLVVIAALLAVLSIPEKRQPALLQNYLTWSRACCETAWARVYQAFNGDHAAMGRYGTFATVFFTFWVFNAVFMFVDFYEWPHFIYRYKVQPKASVKTTIGDNLKPSQPDFWKAIRVAFFNQFVFALPSAYLNYDSMVWRGIGFKPEELPTFRWFILEILVFFAIEEIGFYYLHRLMHTPFFYKYIHKKHHEWTAPVGVISIYAHPLEFAINNSIPVALGPLIMGSHCAVVWAWLFLAILESNNTHIGYHLPFFWSPEMHDFHHQKFNNCFGVWGILDWLHGTDDKFRKSKEYERHFIFFSLTPPRELVKDSQEDCLKND